MRLACLPSVLIALAMCGARPGGAPAAEPAAAELKLLFLGDQGHHRPAQRFADLAPVLADRGIELRYTADVGRLDAESLRALDGLIVYANIDEIEQPQARALLDFVASGKGFIPLHCASYCFRNSPEVVALIGAQFKQHGTGVFGTVIAQPEHPVMRGFHGFSSWDETYIHQHHNEQDRVVLEYRLEGPPGPDQHREPWTWVRTHGRGRVFYTAWGHDERTWGQPGFQNLVERGIRWACGADPGVVPDYGVSGAFVAPPMTAPRTDVQPFKYVDVGPKIPSYTPGAAWRTQGQPLNRMQQPLPAGESQKHYVTPVGFEMRLFVDESRLGGKPIAMNWDERGRLWLCETTDYPNELQPPGQGRDRIRICEDSDGDGQADRFTVFAEQLSIPTTLLFHRGGVIVQNGVETLYLADTDGDNRADVRTVLISGWALGDTHGGVSHFRYGLDNWIWAMQGYNTSQPVIEGRQQQAFRMGFFRFRLSPTDPPRVTELEFLRSTDNNTWGLGFSEEGLVFGSTANHNPSVFLPIPNRYYERVRGWSPPPLGTIADSHLFQAITDKIRQVDHFGGYTAGAGHALYTARTYPRAWWNQTAFVCEPTGHLVGTFVLSREGAGFRATSPCNLVASDDEWAAPIQAEVGPDGNVWVLDWYNYIVQHNPTPHGFQTGKGNAYESELRDKKHGRIYRLVCLSRGEQAPNDAAPRSVTSLANADPRALVQTLADPNMFWRLQAQRLLVARGQQDIGPQLIALAADRSVDEIGLNAGALHALWTLRGLGLLDQPSGEAFQAAVAALQHPSAGVRRSALAVLPAAESSTQAILAAGCLADPDAHVRLAALLALADMPPDEATGKELAGLMRDPQMVGDRWLKDALTSTAATHAAGLLAALSAPAAGARERVDAAAGAVLPIAGIVAEHLARGKLDRDALSRLVTLLAQAEPRLADAVIQGLARGWPRDYQVALSPAAERDLVRLLDQAPASSQAQLVQLATAWGSGDPGKHAKALVTALLDTAADAKRSVAQRVAAAQQVIRLRTDDDQTAERLLELINPQAPPDLAAGLVAALLDSTASSTGKALVQRLAAATPAVRERTIGALLSRPSMTAALLDGIESGRISPTELKLDQKQALNSHPDAQLRLRAQKILSTSGGLPSPDRELVVHARLRLAERSGRAAAGKEMFKKHCAKCHRHSGEGEQIGPDLTGMAVHPKPELLTQILDPSRSVEGNFRVYTVVTDEGRVYTGMLAGETRTSVELIDAEARRHVLPRAEIDELVASTKSLMPEGFEQQMSDEELVDLLEFLTAKGRFVPLDLRRAATIVSTRGMFWDEQQLAEALIFPDWGPKTFAGVPFQLVDPQGGSTPNAILLYGPQGKFPPRMPRDVALPVNTAARAIHLLSGVSGWGSPLGKKGSLSLTVRLEYADGQTEDHPLRNGVHFADYIRRVDVPESTFAFDLRGKQLRYLAIQPGQSAVINQLHLIKGDDETAPVVMAVTVETGNP